MRMIILAIFLLPIILIGCSQNPKSTILYSELPAEGDATRGQELFTQSINLAPACSACHTDTAAASPILAGFSETANNRVPSESAREYAFYSITEPGRYIVEGYGNAMYNQYDEKLKPQDIADLIAYLLSL